MECSQGDNNPVFARGLCQACYYRLRRNGTVERKNVKRGKNCIIDGCKNRPHAKNLCSHHYEQSQHPLRATWSLLRSRHPGLYPPHWDRLVGFLADVGERPTPLHKLKRIDNSLPFTKENMRWMAPLPTPAAASLKEYHAAYGREWNVRTKFGITGAEYERMFNEQDGKCAICCQPETAVDPRNGRPKALAVDHDHKTGEVRGLLDVRCNRILGYARDSVEILRASIAYLEKHAATPLPPN